MLRESFSLSRIEEPLVKLQGSTVFFKMNSNSGFWKNELDPNLRKYTTFITPFGQFQFKKMPFGISAAPEFFQGQVSKILQDLQGVVCMMDDNLVYGKDMREHNERLQQVMRRVRYAGMTLNKKKCQYRVILLGYKISTEGISADPERVGAIKEMKELTKQDRVEKLPRNGKLST